MKGFIYKISNKINNKVYIGQTIQDPKERWYRHCQRKCLSENERNMAIKRAIFKYGKDNFTFEVIEKIENYSKELLDNREIYWIAHYNSYENGYNCTKGGSLGSKPLKISKEEHTDIIDLYNCGFSLRNIAKEYNVDKATIKHILEINNIEIKRTRTYKYSQGERDNIITLYFSLLDTYGSEYSSLLIQNKYKISKSYLSQLIHGKRRI